MKKTIILLFFIFIASYTYSQTVYVIDKSNQKPISNVYVYNSQKTITAISNSKGQVFIFNFNDNDTLNFKHISYKISIITKNELAKNNYKVFLEDEIITLEGPVLSVNKIKEKRSEIPNKIISISNKEAIINNPQTAADVLAISKEVFVQKSQLGGGSPMLRGFAANSVLLVIDGVRMNNAIYRNGNLQNVISLDPNILERTEVLFGPGSVIYGSDALGGVMDFQTKQAIPSHKDKMIISSDIMTRYSTANNEKIGHIDLNIGFKNWAYLTSATYSDFDDLQSGKIFNKDYHDFGKRPEFVDVYNGKDVILNNENQSVQRYTGYEQLNLMQKIRFRPNEYLDINYGFHYSTSSNIPRYDRLTQYSDDTLKYAEWYYGPQKWMMNTLNINYKDTSKIYDEIKITLAVQNLEESRYNRKFESEKLKIRTEKVDVYSLNLDFNKKIRNKNILFYGFEAVHNNVTSKGEQKNISNDIVIPIASRYPDKGNKYSSFAVYLNYKYFINKKLILISGLRYNRVLMKSEFSDDFYDFPFNEIEINTGALNGSLGLVYHPYKSWQINLNLSSGFRAPNIDDVAKVFDSEPGNVVVPNENLKPEYAYNLDFGIIKNINDKAQIEISAFYTYLIDAMVRRDFLFDGKDSIMYDGTLSKVEAVVNTGEAQIYGFSAAISVNLSKHFLFKTNCSWMDGEDGDGIPLRHISPFFGSSSLVFKTKMVNVVFYSDYNGWKKFNDMAPSEQAKTEMYTVDGSPSWYTLNIKTVFQINSAVQLNFGLENIMDIHYRQYSSGISAPGRNFIVALRCSL